MPKQEQSMRLTTHIRKLKQTRNTLRNMQSQSGQNRIQKILVLFYLIFHKINRFKTKPHMSTSKSTHSSLGYKQKPFLVGIDSGPQLVKRCSFLNTGIIFFKM